jgi:hypothetical protein
MGYEVTKTNYGEKITKIDEKDENTLNNLNLIYDSTDNDIYYYNPN